MSEEQPTVEISVEGRWRVIQEGEEERIYRIITTNPPEEASKVLAEESVEAQRTALIDRKTGLYTLAAGKAQLERIAAGHMRGIKPNVSVVSLDLDNFRETNKTGHQGGDMAIIAMANFLKGQVRKGDMLCRRYPTGDEFFIIMSNTDRNKAEELATRILEGTPQALEQAGFRGITTSIGVANLTPMMTNVDKLLIEADTAQIQAKEGGKNRIVVYSSIEPQAA